MSRRSKIIEALTGTAKIDPDQYSPITIVAAVSWHFGDPPESATIAIAAQRPFKCAW